MVDYFLNLLIEYKYWIVIGGALIEGETILLIAGMAAFYGYLDLVWVVVIAFLGAAFHDNALFFLGRHTGPKLFSRFSKLQAKTHRVSELLHRYKNLFIFGFRFVYGIRTITPVLIGTTRISAKRYVCLTLLSGLVWATIVVVLGYWFASIIEDVIELFVQYQKIIAFGIGALIVSVWGWRRMRRKDDE